MIAILFAALSLPVFAGQGGEPAEKAEKFVEVLGSHVEMDAAQTTAMVDIMADHFKAVQELHEKYGESDFEAMKSEMETLRADLKSNASEVLNEEQLTAMMETMKGMAEMKKKKDKLKEMSVEERHDLMLQKLDENLGLTDEQFTEIEAILDSKTETLEGMRAQDEKNHEAHKTLMEEIHSEILEVLDAEQATKFEEMKEKHQHNQ